MEVVKPAFGYLACGDTGAGKMPEPEVLFDYIVKAVGYEKDMVGKKVLDVYKRQAVQATMR